MEPTLTCSFGAGELIQSYCAVFLPVSVLTLQPGKLTSTDTTKYLRRMR